MSARRAVPILVLVCLTGCAWLPDWGERRDAGPAEAEGLERVEADLPGILDVRADHHIGSYDALLIPEASLAYERRSLRLTRDAERVLLAMLRSSIVAASIAAAVPVVDEPARCAMEIDLRVAGFDLQIDDDSPQLAKLTLVMEFRDSMTRQLLLRYAAEDRVPSPTGGETPDRRIRRGLDRVVADMNIAAPFRASGFANDTVLAGCKGTLAARGRATAQAAP
jgi:hypothetical protein